MSEGGGTNGCSGSIVRTRKQNLFQPPQKKHLFLPFTNQTRLARHFWSIEAEMSVIFHFCYGFSHIHLHLWFNLMSPVRSFFFWICELIRHLWFCKTIYNQDWECHQPTLSDFCQGWNGYYLSNRCISRELKWKCRNDTAKGRCCRSTHWSKNTI